MSLVATTRDVLAVVAMVGIVKTFSAPTLEPRAKMSTIESKETRASYHGAIRVLMDWTYRLVRISRP